MKTHHREMYLHASALLHQTGDILSELIRQDDETDEVAEDAPTAQSRNYYVERTTDEIRGQLLTREEIADKLQGIYDIGQSDAHSQYAVKPRSDAFYHNTVAADPLDDLLNGYFPDAVLEIEKEMQSAEIISRKDMLEFLRKLYFRGHHSGQGYTGEKAMGTAQSARLGVAGGNEYKAEQSAINKVRSAAIGDLADRGFTDGSYPQEKTANAFDRDELREKTQAHLSSIAQRCDAESTSPHNRTIKTTGFTYDEAGRVSETRETTTEFYNG